MNAVERRSVLIVATLSAFITPFSSSALNVALPQMGGDLAADGVTLGWIVTAYMLVAAMFLVPLGRIADIKGRKRVFEVGTWIYSAASLMLIFVYLPWVAIGLRALQGLGGAMIFGTGVALLTSVYPPGKRGKALGINIGSVYAGLSVGPVVGGFLTHQFGWRSVFVVSAMLGVAAAVVTSRSIKGEWASAVGESFDHFGAVLFSATIAAVMIGLSSLPSPRGYALIVAGLLLLAAFIAWEAHTAHPVLHVELFRGNMVFALSNVAALLNYCATAAIGFLLSFYLHFVKDLTPQATGLILIAQPALQALFSPLAGRLSDRIEPRVVASIGMAITCTGLLVLASLDRESSLVLVVTTLAALGFGFALFSSPNTNAIMGAVEQRFYGVASGIMGTVRLMGQMLSMGISMSLIAVFIGPVEITSAHAAGLITTVRVAFLVFGCMCFVGIFASLARGKLRRSAAPTPPGGRDDG